MTAMFSDHLVDLQSDPRRPENLTQGRLSILKVYRAVSGGVQTNRPSGHSGSGGASRYQVSYVSSHGTGYITLCLLVCESYISSEFSVHLILGNLFGVQQDEAVSSCFFPLLAFEIRISPKVLRPILPKPPKFEMGFILSLATMSSDPRTTSMKRLL